MQTLFIIRGLPGSGKTTYAAALSKRLGIPYNEADMYFTDKDGNYNFDGTKIGDAHDWCGDQVYASVVEGQSVIVSNTFTTWKEMEMYVQMAAQFGFRAKMIQMNGKWNSVHNVPEKSIAKMQARFVDNKLLPTLPHMEFLEVY
jgi:cytidylate kinase